MKKKISLFCFLVLLQNTLSVRSLKKEVRGNRSFILDNYDIIERSVQSNQEDYESEFDIDEDALGISTGLMAYMAIKQLGN